MPSNTNLPIIDWEGDTWKIIGQGVTREGKTCCHLSSCTRFREHRNGPYPVQMMDWVPEEIIANAMTAGGSDGNL